MYMKNFLSHRRKSINFSNFTDSPINFSDFSNFSN